MDIKGKLKVTIQRANIINSTDVIGKMVRYCYRLNINKEVFSYFLQGQKYVFQESKKGEIKSKILNKTFLF